MENVQIYGKCLSGFCQFALSAEALSCLEGDGGCREAQILEASESFFHDSTLIEATKAIRAVLEMARNSTNANGRKLSFIETSKGLLLAWVNEAHDDELPTSENIVTPSCDDETILAAFKIKMTCSD